MHVTTVEVKCMAKRMYARATCVCGWASAWQADADSPPMTSSQRAQNAAYVHRQAHGQL